MVWCVKVKVFSLENGSELNKEVDLREEVFGLPYDNKFMSMYFARMKSASYVPTNKTKNISEVSGTTSITLEDFLKSDPTLTEADFEHWKNWSDNDYKEESNITNLHTSPLIFFLKIIIYWVYFS